MEVKPGYKQTEMGIIPEDWEVKPLQSTFSLKHGFAFSSEYFSKAGPIVLTPGNFRLEGGLYFEDRNTKRYSGDYSSSMTLSKGDLLIVMTDLTPDCNLLGKPAFVENDEVILHNQRIGKVLLKDKNVQPELLFYLLLSRPYLNRIREQATGSTVRHTSNKSIYSIQLAWPRRVEQCAIAQALSDVDALLVGLDRLIAKKRDLKESAMQQLLNGQTRLKGFGPTRAFKRYDYGSIPEDWVIEPFGKISTMNGRIGWQGLKQGEFTENPNDPFLITGMNFKDGKIRWEEVYHIPLKRYREAAAIQLRIGDVLITKDGTIGKLLFVDEIPHPGMASLNSHLLVFRPVKQKYCPRFLFYQLGSPTFARHIDLHKSGSTFFGLTQAATARYPVVLPLLSEQTAIAEVLTDMDAELTALEQRREKTRALKQAMMQQLLTGRTRLV